MRDMPFSQPRMAGNQHSFAKSPSADIPRSSFDRTFTYKSSFNAGLLVPFYVDEALPGDTFSMKVTSFARLATPVAPIMDNLYCDIFFFAVPNRLIWENWEKFCGAQTNPGDSIDYLIPVISGLVGDTTSNAEGSLWDYFALPQSGSGQSVYDLTDSAHGNIPISALPFRAYNLIYNEWFRDQNIQNSAVVQTDNGPDPIATNYNVDANLGLFRRGKRHDYFTSSLPWPQKGNAVAIPLGTSAPIISNYSADAYGRHEVALSPSATNSTTTFGLQSTIAGSPYTTGFTANPGAQYTPAAWPLSSDGHYNFADLTNAAASTINALRQAFQIQKLLERDARGGTRYTELLRSHFGVISPDARLQRPEFLGGGSTMVNVSPIPQTSATSGANPLGQLGAAGTFSHSGTGFTKSFVEHCTVIGMLSVRADLTYQQGIDRMWTRQTRYDFYWPAFAHLGEQAVLIQELWASSVSAFNVEVFGYQERYAEYRYKPSKITGLLNSYNATPLDYWHLAQKFTAQPALNSTFIVENPPMARVEAVTNENDFILDMLCTLKCARPMPVFSVPGLVDHF